MRCLKARRGFGFSIEPVQHPLWSDRDTTWSDRVATKDDGILTRLEGGLGEATFEVGVSCNCTWFVGGLTGSEALLFRRVPTSSSERMPDETLRASQ